MCIRYKTYQLHKRLNCKGSLWKAENVLFLDLGSGYIQSVKFVNTHQSVYLIYILFVNVCLLQQQKNLFNVPLHTDNAVKHMN